MERNVGTLWTAEPLAGGCALEEITAFNDPVFQEKGRSDRYRSRHQALCWGYRIDGEVAAYFWTTMGPAREPLWRGVDFFIPSGFIYVWDCRTHEPFRRQGLFARGLTEVRRIPTNSPHQFLIACEVGADSEHAIRKQFSPLENYRLHRLWRFHAVNGRLGGVVFPPLSAGGGHSFDGGHACRELRKQRMAAGGD